MPTRRRFAPSNWRCSICSVIARENLSKRYSDCRRCAARFSTRRCSAIVRTSSIGCSCGAIGRPAFATSKSRYPATVLAMVGKSPPSAAAAGQMFGCGWTLIISGTRPTTVSPPYRIYRFRYSRSRNRYRSATYGVSPKSRANARRALFSTRVWSVPASLTRSTIQLCGSPICGGLCRSLALTEDLAQRGIGVIVGAQVGETSLLTRAGLTIAHMAADNLHAMEGGFGTHLLQRDLTSPCLMFGDGGLLYPENYLEGEGIGLGLNVHADALSTTLVPGEV